MKQVPTAAADVTRPLPPFDRPATGPDAPRIAPLKALFAGLVLALAAGCAASGGGSLAPHGGGKIASNIARALPATSPTPAPAEGQSCDDGDQRDAACGVQKNPGVAASKTPSGGLTAAQLRAAYNLTPASSAAANGPLIAIVDAFEDKNAEADLGTYRAQFGLPACT